MSARLFRVVVPVPDMDRGVGLYQRLLGMEGQRVTPTRHYFDCEGVILALVDPSAHGRAWSPNPEPVYLAVDDLAGVFERSSEADCRVRDIDGSGVGIQTRPWGERSFYVSDAFGNPLCFVDRSTVFTGTG